MIKSGKNKKRSVVRRIIHLVFFLLVYYIGNNFVNNIKEMDMTLDEGISAVSGYTELKEIDPGEYRQIKMNSLIKFDVSQYDVEDIGNLSVMKVNMGFMQMVSFVITPFEKEMPMLSMDFMYIMGKRKAYVEFYDLVPDTSTPEYKDVIEKLKAFQEEYSNLAEIPTEPAWYDDYLTVAMHKAGKRADDSKIRYMFSDAVECYMTAAEGLGQLSDEEKDEKIEITQKYTDGLISNGGVSTDVFKKKLGEEKTKDFFDKVFFGTERYR